MTTDTHPALNALLEAMNSGDMQNFAVKLTNSPGLANAALTQILRPEGQAPRTLIGMALDKENLTAVMHILLNSTGGSKVIRPETIERLAPEKSGVLATFKRIAATDIQLKAKIADQLKKPIEEQCNLIRVLGRHQHPRLDFLRGKDDTDHLAQLRAFVSDTNQPAASAATVNTCQPLRSAVALHDSL